jgi:hypothetical protein
MPSSIFCWSLSLLISAFALGPNNDPLPGSRINPIRLGVAYLEPPISIGTPIDDVARAYTGDGLAEKIEGRLRLETDPSLNAVTRELIRRRLAQES